MLPARAEPRPGVRQDAAFHRRHGLIPGGASTSSSEAPRAAPPIELVLDVPGRLNVPRGRRSQGLDVLLPLLPVDPQPQLVAPLVLTLLIRAADVIPLGHQAQRRPAVEQVAQTQFGIHQIIHIAIVGNDGFRIVYQLETLAPQITAVIPVQTQTVGAAVRTIPGIHADVLEAGRGLEAAQGIVPPLVTGTGTDLDLPLDITQMITHVAHPVLPEPLVGKEPAQGIVGLPPVAALDVIAIITFELAGQHVTPVAMARLGGHIDIQIALARFGVIQLQGEGGPAVPDPVLDDRLRLHDLPQVGNLQRLRWGVAINQHYLPFRLGRLNAPGLLSIVTGLDQQRTVALQGTYAADIHRYLPGEFGLQYESIALHQFDTAGQAIAVIQPEGIGHDRPGEQQRQQPQKTRHRQSSATVNRTRDIIHD